VSAATPGSLWPTPPAARSHAADLCAAHLAPSLPREAKRAHEKDLNCKGIAQRRNTTKHSQPLSKADYGKLLGLLIASASWPPKPNQQLR